MRYNIHDALRKVVAYYKRKRKNVKKWNLVMIWNSYHFYKYTIKFTRNNDTFKNSFLFENDKKEYHVLGKL